MKLNEIKIVFQTALKRGQLDENPLRHIKKPKCPESEINIYGDRECERLLKAAQDFTEKSNERSCLKWAIKAHFKQRSGRPVDCFVIS